MSVVNNLFSTNAGTAAVIALILSLLGMAGVVFLLARQQRLLGQYRQLMTGTSGGNIEAILNEHIVQFRATGARTEAVDKLARRLEKEAYHSLQNLGIVRFNPFHDTGSDQSFAIALADGHGNGVILSSLHGRDMTRVYAKPLSGWESNYSLTDEEKEALNLARQTQA